MSIDKIIVPECSPRVDHPQPLLIGLYSSTQRQGKSTVSHLIQTELGNVQQLSFAAPLKEATIAFLEAVGLSHREASEAVYDTKDAVIPSLGVTGRDVLVLIGTKAGREGIHPDVWVNGGMRRAELALWCGQSVVFDDVRFPNEADAIRDRGGYMVAVAGPVRGRISTSYAVNPTEGNLEDYPFAGMIMNVKGLPELRAEVVRVLTDIRGG